MITKEKFCEIIKNIREIEDFIDNVNAGLKDLQKKKVLDIDFYSPDILIIGYREALVDLLQEFFLKEDIEYFIYELNYGEKYTDGCVTLANGTILKMGSPEEFYDTMIEQMEIKDARIVIENYKAYETPTPGEILLRKVSESHE